jgi:hypothetical protein
LADANPRSGARDCGVTHALEASSQWTAHLAEATAWVGYVKSQERMAWKDTLTLIGDLKGPFALASTQDPSLLSRYPSLARLLDAAKLISKRAAATRKRNANASAGAGTGATQPAALEAPSPAPTAPAAEVPVAHGMQRKHDFGTARTRDRVDVRLCLVERPHRSDSPCATHRGAAYMTHDEVRISGRRQEDRDDGAGRVIVRSRSSSPR